MRRWTALVVGIMLAVTTAGAGELAGVSLPDQVTVGGGRRSFSTGWDSARR